MSNKFTYLLMIASASAVLFASCRNTEEPAVGTISLSVDALTIKAEGDNFSVDVTASHGFTVTVPSYCSWISIDGKKDSYSSGTLSFTVAENQGSEPRNGMIIFQCLEAKDTLNVTQEAAEDLFYETFMSYTEPGIYGENFESFIYEDFSSQYSIYAYASGQAFDYKIMRTEPAAQYLVAKSIPVAPETGSIQSLGVQQNITSELSPNYFYTFTVEQVADGKIWLYCSSNRFGIIVTQE